MKKTNRKIIVLAVIVACVSCLIGCAKKENSENLEREIKYQNNIQSIDELVSLTTIPEYESDSGESGESSFEMGFYSTDDKAIFNFENLCYVEYDFDGENVSGIIYYYAHDDESSAGATYTEMKKGYDNGEKEYESVKDMKLEGKYVVVTTKEEYFKDMTKESVMNGYNTLDNYMNNKEIVE